MQVDLLSGSAKNWERGKTEHVRIPKPMRRYNERPVRCTCHHAFAISNFALQKNVLKTLQAEFSKEDGKN